MKARKTIRTLDDARVALVELTPRGATLITAVECTDRKDSYGAHTGTMYRAAIVDRDYEPDYLDCRACTPAELVDAFLFSVLPKIRGGETLELLGMKSPNRRRVNGHSQPRLGFTRVVDPTV